MVFSTVKAHQGQLSIQSEPGQGTRVMMRFPACTNGGHPSGHLVPENSSAPFQSKNVLLVDDDELMRSSVQAILEALGCVCVITASTGEEALRMLEEGLEPDLIILDMNMPGIGGSGTLPRLRRLISDVPVLLSTGRTDQTALSLASAHPGVTVLPKPFGVRELQKHLETIWLE